MFRGPCLFIRSPVQFTCFGTVMLTDLMAPTPLTDNLYCKTVPTEPDKLYLLNPVGTSQVQFCGPSFNDVRATMNTKLIEPVCFPIFTVRGHFSSTGYSPHFTDFLVLLVLTRVRIFTRSPPRLPRRLPRRFPVAASLPWRAQHGIHAATLPRQADHSTLPRHADHSATSYGTTATESLRPDRGHDHGRRSGRWQLFV